MPLDIFTLKKNELLKLAQRRCKHGHNFFSHQNCFKKREGERIGFLDIEAGDLKADYGTIFCYCILDSKTGKIFEDTITKEDIDKWGKEGKEDTRVLRSLIRDLDNFDRVVGHFSSRYDLPFIRTRAVMCGLSFPQYGAYKQSDTWRILRSKFGLSRNSLESGARNLVGRTRKNRLSLPLKNGCIRGKKWAIDTTLDHCRRDVRDTKDLYQKIFGFVKLSGTSI